MENITLSLWIIAMALQIALLGRFDSDRSDSSTIEWNLQPILDCYLLLSVFLGAVC